MIIYLRLLVTTLLWGGTFIAGRLVVLDMGAFAAAFCRFAIADVFVAAQHPDHNIVGVGEGHLAGQRPDDLATTVGGKVFITQFGLAG